MHMTIFTLHTHTQVVRRDSVAMLSAGSQMS